MKKLFTLAFATILFSQAFSQVAAWNVFGQTAYGTQGFLPTTLDANLTAVGLTRGSGLTTANSAGSNLWGGNGFALTTLNNAIDSSKFISFSLTVKPNYALSLSYFDSVRVRISSTGPINFTVQYALGAGTYTTVKSYTLATRPSSTTSYALDTINLSGISELQNIAGGTTVNFRIIPFGATSASGTFYIGNQANVNHIVINGNNTLLPVTLKSISASLINSQPQVHWETSNETNFDYFGVEKSVDAKNFAEIAKVASNKASNGSTYQYADNTKTLTTQYYRLRLVDNDGTFKYSSVVAVNGKPSISLALYPNPVTNTIILSHPKAVAGAAVKVTSIDGKILSTQNVQTGATQTSIDATRLVKGNYVVSFVNNGVSSTTQLVKQ